MIHLFRKLQKNACEVKAQRFTVENEAGQMVAAFGAAPDGKPGLMMCDGSGKVRLMLGVAESGEACVALFDSEGRERLTLQMMEHEGAECPTVLLRNTEQTSVVVLAEVKGGAGLKLGDVDLVEAARRMEAVSAQPGVAGN